jgi:hypothetical protein
MCSGETQARFSVNHAPGGAFRTVAQLPCYVFVHANSGQSRFPKKGHATPPASVACLIAQCLSHLSSVPARVGGVLVAQIPSNVLAAAPNILLRTWCLQT